jgi:hypothetical protein
LPTKEEDMEGEAEVRARARMYLVNGKYYHTTGGVGGARGGKLPMKEEDMKGEAEIRA